MGYTGTNSACQPTRLEVLSSTYVNATDRRKIHFVFTGPSHMNLFIDAKKSTLTSWYVLVLVTAGIQDRDQDLGVLMGSPFVHVFDRSMGNGISGPVVEAEDAYILQFCSGTVRPTTTFGSRPSRTNRLMSFLWLTTSSSLLPR